MTWHNRSLRKQLLLWLFAVLITIGALMLFEVSSSARIAANEAYDRILLGSALAIAERVIVVDDEIDVDIPYVALEMLTSEAQDRVFYQVSGASGASLTGYSDLPPIPDAQDLNSDIPLFYDAVYRGDKVRIGAVSRYISSPKFSTRFVVKVAETVDARDQLALEMLTRSFLRQLILIIGAGVVLWVGISRGFKPLLKLEEALNRRTESDLRPIRHEVPQEVRHLVGAINSLMLRLGNSIEAMQRFTSNAAHQLRTPLAGIQTQADLALMEEDPKEIKKRLDHLRNSTYQSSHLIQQLLSLARATPTDSEIEFSELNLADICREITTELVPRALSQKMDLGCESDENVLPINGQKGLLEEALRNLISNSLTYCEKGARITVRFFKKGDQAIVEVEDNGPGIPVDEQVKIFERFYRIPGGSEEGCGLGLPIVKEIISRHSGHISIINENSKVGTVFRIQIPMTMNL